jgi:hypothetical protein
MEELKKWIIDIVRKNPGKYDEHYLVYLSNYLSCDTRETIHALIRSKRLTKGKSGCLKIYKSHESNNTKNPGSGKQTAKVRR